MIFSGSETNRLRKLIVHRPDYGLTRIDPKDAERLLFDDIVYYPLISAEYDLYARILKSSLGEENVLFFGTLLRDTLAISDDIIEEMLSAVAEYSGLNTTQIEDLKALDIDTLVKVVISGYDTDKDVTYFDPVPNLMFTRDIGVTVNNGLIITKAFKPARKRENILTSIIVKYHPLFEMARESGTIINLNDTTLFPNSADGDEVTIEGGDMMMIHQDYLLVGVSIRSSEHGFELLKSRLHKLGLVKNVVKIQIPESRSYMHIDTLFTQVADDLVVCFKPIIVDGEGLNVEVHSADGSVNNYDSVPAFYHSEINPNMQFVYSANGISPAQEREQWTDSCNLLALKPGVAISYDRNEATAKAFENVGYSILKAEDFLAQYEDIDNPLDQIEKTIITLPSAELSRARGGSHCMSFPILRDK